MQKGEVGLFVMVEIEFVALHSTVTNYNVRWRVNDLALGWLGQR